MSLLLLAVTVVMAGCGAPPSGESERPQLPVTPEPTVEMAYDFTLTTLDGEEITLSDLRGEWVLVNFWATWCPPCVREMPYLQEIARTRDIHVLGLNANEKEPVVRKFVEDHAIEFPILMGMDQILGIAYNARSLPQTYMVAPDGSIAHRVIGAITPESFEPWLDDHAVPLRLE